MKLKFLLAAFCLFNISLENAYCDTFKDLKGEEKLDYGWKKYKTNIVKAFDEYNAKAKQCIEEKKDFPDSEINPIFSKALKWGAKYLKELSVSEEEDIPEEFLRVIGDNFTSIRTEIAFGKEEEEDSPEGAPLELKKEVSKLHTTCIIQSQFGPERFKPQYEQFARKLETLDDEIDQKYKQKPYISILAIETLVDMIEDKNEDAITRRLPKNIWKLSYLYRAMEIISPGFFSSHLPQTKRLP